MEREGKDKQVAVVFTFLSELLMLFTRQADFNCAKIILNLILGACQNTKARSSRCSKAFIHKSTFREISLMRFIFSHGLVRASLLFCSCRRWISVRAWQLPQWEERFIEMIDAFEEHKTELQKILKINDLEPPRVSKMAVQVRTIEERRLDARIDYRGGRNSVFSKGLDFYELIRPHVGDSEDQYRALNIRVMTSIDDWIAQDARINRYPINPETCTPPAMTETEEKLREFQKKHAKEDLVFYQSVAKVEFRKHPWHRWGCDNCRTAPILGTMYDCPDCTTTPRTKRTQGRSSLIGMSTHANDTTLQIEGRGQKINKIRNTSTYIEQ
ncbi:hypothetical protein CPB86DRAFT_91119 [Serendipita vermifera]|nr:hypothetical protein CPB86DRAFT_91119 [Serendipita vermifera]